MPQKASPASFDWMQLQVPDFNDPNFSQASHHNPLDEFLDCKLKQGKRIIIHCAAGKEWTGTISAALLIRQG